MLARLSAALFGPRNLSPSPRSSSSSPASSPVNSAFEALQPPQQRSPVPLEPPQPPTELIPAPSPPPRSPPLAAVPLPPPSHSPLPESDSMRQLARPKASASTAKIQDGTANTASLNRLLAARKRPVGPDEESESRATRQSTSGGGTGGRTEADSFFAKSSSPPRPFGNGAGGSASRAGRKKSVSEDEGEEEVLEGKGKGKAKRIVVEIDDTDDETFKADADESGAEEEPTERRRTRASLLPADSAPQQRPLRSSTSGFTAGLPLAQTSLSPPASKKRSRRSQPSAAAQPAARIEVIDLISDSSSSERSRSPSLSALLPQPPKKRGTRTSRVIESSPPEPASAAAGPSSTTPKQKETPQQRANLVLAQLAPSEGFAAAVKGGRIEVDVNEARKTRRKSSLLGGAGSGLLLSPIKLGAVVETNAEAGPSGERRKTRNGEGSGTPAAAKDAKKAVNSEASRKVASQSAKKSSPVKKAASVPAKTKTKRRSLSLCPAPAANDGYESSTSVASTASSSADLDAVAYDAKYHELGVSNHTEIVLNNDCEAKGGVKQKSKSFAKLRFDSDASHVVRKGEVVEVKSGQPGIGGWYGVVEDIRSLEKDIINLTPDSKPTLSAQKLYVKVGWLWSRRDLLDQPAPHSKLAWRDPSYVMGPNERVKTDCTDWRMQGMLRGKKSEILYVFDDCYPAPAPLRDRPAAHPLSHYSTAALFDVQSTPYPHDALLAPNPPLTPADLATQRASLPYFFFGVGGERGPEGRHSELLKPVKRNREPGTDGRRGTAYVRSAFTFKPQKKIEPIPERRQDEDDDEESESEAGGSVRGENGTGGKNGKRKRGRASIKGQASKKAKKENGGGGKDEEKVWPLDFTRHSLDRKPYNPRNVQHYSRSAKTWYEVRELKENNHVRRAPAPDPVKPATTKESSSHARLSPSLGEYFPPSQSKATASSSSSADDLVQRLTALSTQPTVRGGAYGLIGNSYLVVRATELLSLLSPSSSSNSSSSSSSPSFSPVDPAATRAEASMLLSSFSKWERLVQDRVDGVRDGNGLAKEWRGREEAGEGKRWVCPVSREVI